MQYGKESYLGNQHIQLMQTYLERKKNRAVNCWTWIAVNSIYYDLSKTQFVLTGDVSCMDTAEKEEKTLHTMLENAIGFNEIAYGKKRR